MSLLQTSSEIAALTATAKTIRDGCKYIKLDTGFKAISGGYKEFLKKKGNTTSTYVGAALDALDGALDIAETCQIYGKIKANRDAYLAYIDLMYYMAAHGSEDYVKIASYDLAQIIQDETWNTYDKQLLQENTEIVLLTTLDIATDLCPYVKVAKSAYDLTKLTISLTGLTNSAKMIVSCRTMQSVSDGCIHYADSYIESSGRLFSCGDSGLAYMVQLAQSRLVGEDQAKQRLLKGDLGVIISRWLTSTGKDDIEDIFRTISGEIYSYAKGLGLVLSDKLPYYSDFYGRGTGGGMGGR